MSGIGLLAVLAALILAGTRPPQAANAPAPSAAVPPGSTTLTGSLAAVAATPDRGAVVLWESDQSFDITMRPERPPVSTGAAFMAWMLARTDETEKFLRQKWDLAQVMLRAKSITRKRVLEAFLLAPREYFCRDTRRAYENAVLPIGYGQTISGPHMVARMTDWLDPQPGQKVLEIGTGSGYQSAVLSELANRVYTIEIVEALARETDAIFRRREAKYPEYRNILRKIDDGYYGWAEYAPFDRIIVTCGIDHVPPELLRQLAPDGIMVIPVGPPSGQTILRIVKRVAPDGSVTLEREDIFQGKKRDIFVPFTAPDGSAHQLSNQGPTK
jgi:protein-L-isoaspartate(D-aspartate) O-methyltransferase